MKFNMHQVFRRYLFSLDLFATDLSMKYLDMCFIIPPIFITDDLEVIEPRMSIVVTRSWLLQMPHGDFPRHTPGPGRSQACPTRVCTNPLL